MLNLSKWMSGLGPNSWGWFRIFLPYSILFYESSCMHDLKYTEWWEEINKVYADFEFLKHNLEKSKTKLQRFFAKFYYFLVNKYWYYYFNYKKTI